MPRKSANDSLQQVLENAQVALQEALDALSSGEEAGPLDSPVGSGGGQRPLEPLGLPGGIGRLNLGQILAAKRAGKGFDSTVAGVNLACDEGC